MPQQINLRTPALQAPKIPLSANTMVLTLALFALVGGALLAYWVWRLEAGSAELTRTLSGYTRERERLQATLKESQASALPAEPGLTQELLAQRELLQQRELLRAELGRGLLRGGPGHAARLRLVAQTIPAEVWVTEVRANELQMEVYGHTLDPAALNEWVSRLAAHPVLKGHALSAIKVERAAADAPDTAAGASRTARSRPTWSFTLVSTALGVAPAERGGGS